MVTMKDRENAFESKFAHDADMAFKATARRNKLLGLWAAGLLGKTGQAADRYAAEVVRSSLEYGADAAVLDRLLKDLRGHSDKATLQARMAHFMAVAKSQIMDEHS